MKKTFDIKIVILIMIIAKKKHSMLMKKGCGDYVAVLPRIVFLVIYSML